MVHNDWRCREGHNFGSWPQTQLFELGLEGDLVGISY